MTPHYRIPQTLKIRCEGTESVAIAADTQDHRSYGAWNKDTRSTDSDQCSLISICYEPESYINWNPTTIFNTLEVTTSLYSLLANFKMRFISFIIAGAMLTFFDIYAYAKPVRLDDPGIGHLAPWCEGYNDDTCHSHCKSEGFKNSNCTAQYVQMPYKFNLTLTCNLQILYLRVSYPTFY